MKVAHLTIVYAADIDAKQAHHLTDEIADEALSYEAVDAVRCEVAEFDQGDIDAFDAEAAGLQEPRMRTHPVIEDSR